ncbi:aminotransferase class V-fold PLP-dependent enzyme [Leptobacterium sp. I13]|uniref:aminotransferase class V-fold PLP-dependent enzyme n=1 Tax=Leptobacterium meishanense TaxID=3128904 RepID=UPI0030EC983D
MDQHFQKDFPVIGNYTYLDTAASGLLYERLMEWRQEHDIDFLIGGSLFREEHHALLESIRGTVGKFFNCSSERVSLIPNFSFGFTTLLNGLDKKQKVLLLKNDYPSINWQVEAAGYKTCYVTIDECVEERIKIAVEKEQPDILALSLVQYINGIKIDLGFLKSLKEAHPDLLIVADGTQYCGTEIFDFEASGIDVLGASGYKWLLGGYGNGFMFFKEAAIKKIYPDSFEKESRITDFSSIQCHLMNHFEPGHQDTLNYGSLQFSLKYLSEIGLKPIEEHLKHLSITAKQKLEALGLLEEAIVKRAHHSTIFNMKGDEELFNRLRNNAIICSQRGSGIRVSFHFYNTEKDLNRLLLQLRK